MGKPTGFLEYEQRDRGYAPVEERLKHFGEFVGELSERNISRQGARCMDCGIPFCHSGCPVNNIIPDWNDLVYKRRWEEAIEILHSTNNFPEFTGRVCPAPCEAACTLNLTDEPVTIKTIECAIIDRAWEEGWIKPQKPLPDTGKKVAVVGSGPAGLAAAQQLIRAGHGVSVFEKNLKMGGLLRYGIPDFKLDKGIIDRRIGQMEAEGVEFRANVNVGQDLTLDSLEEQFDAVILAQGSEVPRGLPIPGADLEGVHFAMDFLAQQNRRVSEEPIKGAAEILATGKNVVVIGGGDTGSDCVGTSIRQGAKSVTQFEILPLPPEKEIKNVTWPHWPDKLRSSTSHEEGVERIWSIKTNEFKGDTGRVSSLDTVLVDWREGVPKDVANSEKKFDADLVLLAMGFLHPRHEGLVSGSELELDERGNVKAEFGDFLTSRAKVFAAGDVRRGQSLIVWAIREGRDCAGRVDEFLKGAPS
ncbi:MAG: glutamate synthase subunit beta [Rhodospirillales bacterium]|nr:glutamate synthase subunit beta [Rhodospirillales bacterium]